MNDTAVIGYNINGNLVRVATIDTVDQHVRKNLYEGAHYRLTAKLDDTGALTHYVLTIIPESQRAESSEAVLRRIDVEHADRERERELMRKEILLELINTLSDL